jgi:outer membrane protein, heavy metal efflux system
MKTLPFILIALLAACATVPRDGGIADVQREVNLRTNQNVEARGSASSTDDERVRTLLAGELDADKTVAVAILNSPRVQVALADLGLARADLLEASTIRNPIFSAEIRFPASPTRPYELSIMQSLIDLAYLPRRRSAGRAAFEAAKSRVAADVLTIAADVRGHFYDLVAATQHVAMDRITLEAAKAAAELAQRQHDAGNITDLDLENQQAMYEQAIGEDFPALPPSEPGDVEIQQLLATRRLDIAAARNDVEAARRLAPFARASSIGEADLGVHREHDAGGDTTTGPDIQVPIPIFNRGTAAKTRADAQRLRAEQELALLTATAASEARAARQSVLAARARVDYYRDVILPRRKRIVDLTLIEHNAMLAGTFQLLQAKQSEAEAHREFIDAQRDYWLARASLDRALSGFGAEPQNRFLPATMQSQGRTAQGGR